MRADDIVLHYENDARSLNVSVLVTDPDTGEKEGVTFDNLSTALYLIATSEVRIVEEYLGTYEIDLGNMHDHLIRVPASEESEERVVTGGEVMAAWIEEKGPLALHIDCHGDPAIVREWNSSDEGGGA